MLLFRFQNKIGHKIKNGYVANFKTCQKCKKGIDPRNGFWHYKNKYPLIGGFYHTECGTINNSTKSGMPF